MRSIIVTERSERAGPAPLCVRPAPSPPTEGLVQLPQLCAPKASDAPRTRQCAAPSAQSACRSSRRSCLPPRPPAAAECGRRVLEYSKVPADAEGLGVLSPVVEYRRRPRRRRRPGYMFVCLLAVGSRARLMAAISCRGGQSPSAPLRVPGARCATGVRCVPNARRATGVGCMCDRCRLHAAALSLLQHERLELGVQVRFAPPRLRHLAPWTSRRSAAARARPRPSARKEARRWPVRAHRRFGRVRALELPLKLRELQGCRTHVGARQASRRRNGRLPQAIGRRRLCR